MGIQDLGILMIEKELWDLEAGIWDSTDLLTKWVWHSYLRFNENIALQIIFIKTKKVSEVLDQPSRGPNLDSNFNLYVMNMLISMNYKTF